MSCHFEYIFDQRFIQVTEITFNICSDIFKFNNEINKIRYTGWLVIGGTSGKGVILREKRSRKYRIKIFRLRLCFRENRL